MSNRLVLALLLSAPVSAFQVANAAGLVPPPGFTQPADLQGGEGKFKCEDPPKAYTGTLKFPSKYEGSDKSRDKLNPKAEARYKKQTQPITDFEKGVAKLVEEYVDDGHPEAADCAMRWLDAWAKVDALRDRTDDHTGKSMRKWSLASVASAYVRLKFASSQPLARDGERAARVERWLGALGDQVVADWSGQPLAKINNHEYWAAWAAMAGAVALNRRDLFDWAVAMYRTAASQVDPQGYLPNELARDTRALNYHNYALGPLAMIAAFAKANGLELAPENNGALTRLATRTLMGIDRPELFAERTGEKQNVDELQDTQSKLAWLEPYCWATGGCQGPLAERVKALRPLGSTRLGGNLTNVFARGTHLAMARGPDCEQSPEPPRARAVKAAGARPPGDVCAWTPRP